MSDRPRIGIIVPCLDGADLVGAAVRSVAEREPVETVIVDAGCADQRTQVALSVLAKEGHRVVRHEGLPSPAAVRHTGLRSSTATYVFCLDAHDRAAPGMLAKMADRLDAEPFAGVCYGDYEEYRLQALARAVPERLDPYRIIHTNEYPVTSLFRREALEAVGGWTRLIDEVDARSDWHLWMTLAERQMKGVHLGRGRLTYLRRMHGRRLSHRGRAHDRRIYRALRERHHGLFEARSALRARSRLGRTRRALYPLVYGPRPSSRIETASKSVLDRIGVWTLTAPLYEEVWRQIRAAFAATERSPSALRHEDERPARVAVIIPCYGDGKFVLDAVRSVDEREPVEIVVVDDGSPDALTREALDALERSGHRVIRRSRNEGVSAARNAGLAATEAPYVFPLDADDLAVPNALAGMADRLDREPEVTVCFGDYAEFRIKTALRQVPDRINRLRATRANEYPGSALFRREALEALEGWRADGVGTADGDVWKGVAGRGTRAVYLGGGEPTYQRRVGPRGSGFHQPNARPWAGRR